MAVAVPDTETFTLSLDDYNAEFISQALASEALLFQVQIPIYLPLIRIQHKYLHLPFSPPLDRNSDGV